MLKRRGTLIFVAAIGFIGISAPARAKGGAAPLNDFHTDGCSWAPDGSFDNPTLLLPCCYRHDIAYYVGGTAEDRQNADLELASCTERRSGSETLATIFYYSVRVGGRPTTRKPRWGKAWPTSRGYQALTAEERAEVEEKLAAFDCPSEIRAKFTQDPNAIHDICGD